MFVYSDAMTGRMEELPLRGASNRLATPGYSGKVVLYLSIYLSIYDISILIRVRAG